MKKRNIFWNFYENPAWWRHVTSHDVILQKIAKILLKKCWRQQKILGMGPPVLIFYLELSITFHLVGQPTFYDYWFTFNHPYSGGTDFELFFDDVVKKVLTSAKNCWQCKWSEYFWKLDGGSYFHAKFYLHSTFCSNFMVGGVFLPPPHVMHDQPKGHVN